MRKWLRTFRTALRALRRNIMRSFLTTLGIIIGVAAVIAMMEITGGSSRAIQNAVATMGGNNLLVVPGTAASSGVSFGAGSIMTLTPQDCGAILRDCPAVRAGAPVVRTRTQVVCGNRNWVPCYIYGTTPQFLDVRDWTALAAGEPFTDRDVRNGNRVCLLGKTLVRELFQNRSPIGQEVRVKNVSFKVVGVLSRKGSDMTGTDQDDILLAPWTAIKYRVAGSSVAAANPGAPAGAASAPPARSSNPLYASSGVSLYPAPSHTQAVDTPLPVRFVNVDQIIVAARSREEMPTAVGQMTAVLRERHRIRAGESDDFIVRDLTEVVQMASSITVLMTRLLLCVAAISLVVGGVGIMNIMLVSVTERTREIGLRMAVGAQAGDILRQFLVEAVLLCLAGGVLGILFGRLTSHLVTTLLGWPTGLSVTAIATAVLVSASVGIVFGFYPAWKASRLDPIDALRYE